MRLLQKSLEPALNGSGCGVLLDSLLHDEERHHCGVLGVLLGFVCNVTSLNISRWGTRTGSASVGYECLGSICCTCGHVSRLAECFLTTPGILHRSVLLNVFVGFAMF